MSTRANVILKEGESELFFYRHSDGYPKGTMPSLNLFTKWLKDGEIRKNLQQASGWLIVIGALEYSTIPVHQMEEVERYGGRKAIEVNFESIQPPKDWKVGAYEPTDGLHYDIEYLYTIDIQAGEISVQTADYNYKTGKSSFAPVDKNELV